MCVHTKLAYIAGVIVVLAQSSSFASPRLRRALSRLRRKHFALRTNNDNGSYAQPGFVPNALSAFKMAMRPSYKKCPVFLCF